MAGHTSRPWHLEVEVVNLWIHGPQGEVIATLPNTPQGRTNARLIAAAPELLAALQRALPLLVRLGDFIGNGDVDPTRPDSLGVRCDVIEDARALLARIEGKRRNA